MLEEITAALGAIHAPGTFATRGTASPPGGSRTRFPVEPLVAALREARARHAPRELRALGLGRLREHCAAALAAALAAPQRDAGDWSIAPR